MSALVADGVGKRCGGRALAVTDADIGPGESVTCLWLMKPEHLDWLHRIWQILDDITPD
jgi:hypothetical protein